MTVFGVSPAGVQRLEAAPPAPGGHGWCWAQLAAPAPFSDALGPQSSPGVTPGDKMHRGDPKGNVK